MKVYLIMHEGSPQWHKLTSWVDIDRVGSNGVSVRSVRAFTKKKYAKEWLREKGWDHLIIRSAEIKCTHSTPTSSS